MMPLPEGMTATRRDVAGVVFKVFGDRTKNSEDRDAESRTSLGGSFILYKSEFGLSLGSANAE